MANITSETVPAIDLAEMNTRAEGLRGATNKQVIRILGARATQLGLRSAGNFENILSDSITHWRSMARSSSNGSYSWDIPLGTQGRNSALTLVNGELEKSRKTWAQLQLTGYLSRLEAVDVTSVTTTDPITQIAVGVIEGVSTSVTLNQTEDQIWAHGSGPLFETER